MAFLRKESGVDVLDLTLLQKRGILKMPERIDTDIVDLTLPKPSHPSFALPEQNAPCMTTPIADNPFSMLDAVTLSGSAEASSLTGATPEPSTFNALKLKIDDLEFKIEKLVEKFSLFDERLRQSTYNERHI